MPKTPRRRFLRAVLLAPCVAAARALSLRAQGLGAQFAMPSQPPCTDARKATPEVKNVEAYKPNAPQRSLIAEGGVAGVLLTFTGTVIGLTCGVIRNARVEVWHADIRGEYDMKGFNHRGMQLTDEKGAFAFQTTPPGAVAGFPPHINVRVQPPGKAPFSTRVFVPATTGLAKDPTVPQELVAKVDHQDGKRTVTFNVILNM